MASSSEASCISDPNFAVICAFLERFAKSCGITYPTFAELQEMLENDEQVPQELIELHIKLLRKARKTVFLEKWERALIKFCHTYSSQDGWEIERFGYKKSRLEVKLRVLKMLLEGQFDLNSKFKASINTLESEELRSKPLGKDKLGRIYWLQFDPSSNIRVYREDLDEESWTLVAKDRTTLVQLLQELSGEEFPIDLTLLNEDSNSLEIGKPFLDTGQFESSDYNIQGDAFEQNNETVNVIVEKDSLKATKSFPEEELDKSFDDSENFQTSNKIFNSEEKTNQCNDENETIVSKVDLDTHTLKIFNQKAPVNNEVVIGETIEEPVMYVIGEGKGEDCNTGNPDNEEKSEECSKLIAEDSLTNKQATGSGQDTSELDSLTSVNSPDKSKPTPKLWSIDAICGVNSSKQTDSEVYNIERQESLDGKLIQKNFSKFSIDSVLEKKDLNSVFSDSPLTKFSVISSGDSLPDKLQCNELDSSSVKILHNDQDSDKLKSNNDSQVLFCSVNFKTENLKDEVEKEKLVNQMQTSHCLKNISDERDQNVRGKFSDILNVQENLRTLNEEQTKFEGEKEEISEREGEKKLINEVEFCPLKALEGNELTPKDVSIQNDLEKIDGISEKERKDCSTGTKEKMILTVTREIVGDEKSQTGCMEGAEENETIYSRSEPFEERNLQTENILTGETQKIKNEKCLKIEDNPKPINEIVLTDNVGVDCDAKRIVGSDKILLGCIEKSLEKMEMEKAETLKVIDITEIAVNFKSEIKEITLENNDKRKIEHSNLCENVDSDYCENQNVDNSVEKKIEIKSEAITSKMNENLLDASNEGGEKASLQELDISNEEADSNKNTKQTTDEKLDKEVVEDNEKAVSGTSEESENSNKEDKIEGLLKVSDNVTKEDEMAGCENSKVTRRRKKEVVPQRVSLRNRRITEGENIDHDNLEKAASTKRGRRAKSKESNDVNCDLRANKNKTKDVKDEFENLKNVETEMRKQLPVENDISDETGEIEDVKQAQQEVNLNKKVRKRFSRKHRRRRRRNVEEEVVGDVQHKGNKQSKSNQEEDKDDGKNKKKGRPKREEIAGQSKSRQIPAREIKLLGLKDADTELPSIRQSRRIAQIKMKEEAERRRIEALQLESFKNKKNKSKTGKKKQKKNADSDSFEEKYEKEDDSSEEKLKVNKDGKKRRRKKKKDKLVFNELNPWLSSSGSSSADEEEDDIDDEPHEDEELVFKSDHEFSPESDIEDPDYKPIKRARTAKVEESKDDAGKYDDTVCEKCGNNDHPEWILLCDKCDKGWHASCVRPALMVVPEGDWFCPPCEHFTLIQKLQESLAQYDRCQKQRENEELRKKRLAFVGISLDNVLPTTKKKSSKHEDEDREEDKEDKEDVSDSDSGSDSENSYSSSRSDDSSEPVYQLRERRSTVTSYRYNEYDELIKSALQDEIEAVKGAGNAGRGKDINNIVNAQKDIKEEEGDQEQTKKKDGVSENMEVDWKDSVNEDEDKKSYQNDRDKVKNDGVGNDTDREDEDEEDENVVDEIPPVVPKYNSNNNKKKKSKSSKITSLDFTSEEEDHNSDSDFKGSSSEEESDYSLLSESESSDDIRGRKKSGEGPLRRSTRARVSRYDRDFINDESEEDSPKRKKHRKISISSESSDSDRSWGRRKKKGNKSLYRSSKKKSPKKGKRKKLVKDFLDSENEDSMTTKKSRSRKIKYGGLDCLDEEKVLTRRTRGKKINYQEMNGSDSDEDTKRGTKKSSRIIESDDDFVAENEKDDDLLNRESEEEVESSVDDDTEDIESNPHKKETGSNGKKNKILERIKKKKWVIPDPDDFSENDLMEDEQLDKFVEELEDLDEEEEEILGNIIESGDVPIKELKAAIKRAKEERRLKKEDEIKEQLLLDKKSVQMSEISVAYTPGHSDCPNAGNGKFPKVEKAKITPCRAESSSQFGGMHNQTAMPLSGKPISFIQSTTGSFIPEKRNEGLGPTPPKEKHSDSGDSVGGFLLRTLQSDQKLGSVSNVNIPSNHSAVKDETSVLRPYASYSLETAPSSSLNVMAMINPQSPGGPGDNGCANMIPMSVSSGCSIPQYNAFQTIVPPSRISSYPANIPTTVTGLSNADQLRKKPGPKPGTKNKRKMDELSSELDSCGDSSESGDIRSTLQQGDEFIPLKGVQDSPPKKKGRGRGKKQLLAEAQAKQDVAAPLVQTPVSYPPQGLSSEGGSVITRMLSTPQGPQTFPGNDSNRFSPGPRNRLPFRPALPPHFANSPRPIVAMRLRPAVGSSIFHTSHPLDPSPSGGGAISIPVTSSGLTKPSLPGSNFNRAPGMPMMPRFPSDPNLRHPFSPQNSPPRPEFSSFPNYFGNFPPPSSSVPNNEDSSFTNPSFPESYEESQITGNSKPFEDETGGEFGGLASYFASQREDDLDT